MFNAVQVSGSTCCGVTLLSWNSSNSVLTLLMEQAHMEPRFQAKSNVVFQTRLVTIAMNVTLFPLLNISYYAEGYAFNI